MQGRKTEQKEDGKTPSLLSRINRGGLWDITEQMKCVLLRIEMYFRNLSKNAIGKIDIEKIEKLSVNDIVVRNAFNEICNNSELKIDNII